MNLLYQRYIDHVRASKKSPKTIANYCFAAKSIRREGFDSDAQAEQWKYLLELFKNGHPYSAVRSAFILSTATLDYNGIAVQKNADYNDLLTAIKNKDKERADINREKSYNESELREVLRVAQAENYDLFRLIVLCIYSGLRVSAPQHLNCRIKDDGKGLPHRPLHFKDFELAPNLPEGPRVYCYTVCSKDRHCIAAISEYAKQLLEMTNVTNQDQVVAYDPSSKSPFDVQYRQRFKYLLRKYALFDIAAGKQPFHSMRKFFEAQVEATPGLLYEERKLLYGYVKKDITNTHYVNPTDKAFYTRVASIYQKTPLATLKLL